MPLHQPIHPFSPPAPPDSGAPPAAVPFAVLAVALAGLIAPRSARADEPPAGVVVQFPAVLTADTAVRLRAAVDVPLKRYQRDRLRKGQPTTGFKLLCDFNADGDDDGRDYGACFDVADALRDYQQKYGVATRAYVHGAVSRHAVLPVLACAKIVMSADPPARLGPVTEPDRPLDEAKLAAYRAAARDHFPLAVVRKMYERDLVVVRLSPPPPNGDRFVDKADVKPPLNTEPAPGLGAGQVAGYDYAQALEYGLTKGDKQNDLAAARKDFGLPAGAPVYALREPTVAGQIRVEGAIDGTLREDLERRLNRALGDHVNVLILDLECGGGDDRSAYDLGKAVADLKAHADRPIKTIAYVSSSASDLSAFLALSCDEIVMQEDAVLGRNFQGYLKEHPDRVGAIRDELKDTADKSVYAPGLAEALVNPDVRLVWAGDHAVLTGDEWAANPKLHGAVEAEVKPAGTWLQLNAADARKYGVADHTVKDYGKLCGEEHVRPAAIEGDWLKALAEFLRSEVMSVLLVMVGVTCLIIELKMPGASVPGVIAAVCFVVFFWSQSQVAGQITWLAVLLFILGLILIGIEVFLVPGTGVCGVSGVLLTVGGLGAGGVRLLAADHNRLDGLRPEAVAVQRRHHRVGICGGHGRALPQTHPVPEPAAAQGAGGGRRGRRGVGPGVVAAGIGRAARRRRRGRDAAAAGRQDAVRRAVRGRRRRGRLRPTGGARAGDRDRGQPRRGERSLGVGAMDYATLGFVLIGVGLVCAAGEMFFPAASSW